MLKILQARLQLYVNQELADVQAEFRKGRGTRNQIANTHWIIVKTREFQKNYTSASLTMPKPLTVWIRTNCGTFFKRWECQTTLLLLLLSRFSHVRPTLCDPIYGSPPGPAVPGILQARTLEWVAISFSNE